MVDIFNTRSPVLLRAIIFYLNKLPKLSALCSNMRAFMNIIKLYPRYDNISAWLSSMKKEKGERGSENEIQIMYQIDSLLAEMF